MPEIQVFPLVANVALPEPAPAKTRARVPPGYGVQEQCLPFTAATALGFLVKSPIDFGLCLPAEVPADGRAFRSPLDRPGIGQGFDDARVFYVKDNPHCHFVGNAFALEELPTVTPPGGRASTVLEPGISFFDRADQGELFKLHLPYVWRTPEAVDALFLPPINRCAPGFEVLAGLVETDWYASPVNLVLRKPPAGHSVHVAAGTVVAQVIFVARAQRRPVLKVVPAHARIARELRGALVQWYRQRAADRSTYRRLARSHQGRGADEEGATDDG